MQKLSEAFPFLVDITYTGYTRQFIISFQYLHDNNIGVWPRLESLGIETWDDDDDDDDDKSESEDDGEDEEFPAAELQDLLVRRSRMGVPSGNFRCQKPPFRKEQHSYHAYSSPSQSLNYSNPSPCSQTTAWKATRMSDLGRLPRHTDCDLKLEIHVDTLVVSGVIKREVYCIHACYFMHLGSTPIAPTHTLSCILNNPPHSYSILHLGLSAD
ncbi:hypothetical protein FIBSPDRAFT_944215 [Athelia psychrophila]|uniref:Uncharacterized protein n=1 Tax=Athelia psychrophila TaxID=1759441 RepID=A0A166VGL3_9AGAM|nr:hypothetical protein FIBSPDRAFT_944215 [Fibularhizoctonia sp. CBS 109695]